MPPTTNSCEWYETPAPYTAWLAEAIASRGMPFTTRLRYVAPCVGSEAIQRALADHARPAPRIPLDRWVTNDVDPRWLAHYHRDAAGPDLWGQIGAAHGPIDWVIDNPPFTPALAIIEQALAVARIGVAMHLRASIHEVLKRGIRRTWMRDHPPTGCLWLPRFAFQRSPTTGAWTTDAVTTCWLIWLTFPLARPATFVDYAPAWVVDDLHAYTPGHRARMDAQMAAWAHQTRAAV